MFSSLSATHFPALGVAQETGKNELVPVGRGNTSQGPPDDVLIARICEDDSEALGLLFERYARLVWTISFRILRNKEEAEDLLQDIFLLVRRRASAFDASKGSVRSLLVQMCYQRSFTRRRDLARLDFYSSREMTDVANKAKAKFWGPSYDECLEARFGKEAMRRAVRRLSTEQRETLRLCFGHGYSIEEVAARLACSVGNARHHYYRGLAKMREELLNNRQ